MRHYQLTQHHMHDLTAVAGVQCTITVSALSNGRESQNNPQVNIGMCSATWNDGTSVTFFFLTIEK